MVSEATRVEHWRRRPGSHLDAGCAPRRAGTPGAGRDWDLQRRVHATAGGRQTGGSVGDHVWGAGGGNSSYSVPTRKQVHHLNGGATPRADTFFAPSLKSSCSPPRRGVSRREPRLLPARPARRQIQT